MAHIPFDPLRTPSLVSAQVFQQLREAPICLSWLYFHCFGQNLVVPPVESGMSTINFNSPRPTVPCGFGNLPVTTSTQPCDVLAGHTLPCSCSIASFRGANQATRSFSAGHMCVARPIFSRAMRSFLYISTCCDTTWVSSFSCSFHRSNTACRQHVEDCGPPAHHECVEAATCSR